MLNLIFSDIHANLPALEAVLWDAVSYNVDRVICLGDILGYGPFPKEVVAKLRRVEAECILGNHDIALLGLASGRKPKGMRESIITTLAWQTEQLSPEELDWVAKLTPQKEYRTGRHHSFLCSHGSPRSTVTYVDTLGIAREEFAAWSGEICFVGHTHLPMAYSNTLGPTGDWVSAQELEGDYVHLELRPETRYILNPGSVGQPRDGNPKAAYGLFDDEKGIFEVRRISYEIQETAKAIRKSGLDELSAMRLSIGQ